MQTTVSSEKPGTKKYTAKLVAELHPTHTSSISILSFYVLLFETSLKSRWKWLAFPGGMTECWQNQCGKNRKKLFLEQVKKKLELKE